MEKILDVIKARWSQYKNSKWSIETDVVNGVLIPVAILDKTARKAIVHHEHGIKYGASEFSKESIEQKANAIMHSPTDVQILIKALECACGFSAEKMEYHLQHASKQLRIDCGEIKEDVVRRDYRSS